MNLITGTKLLSLSALLLLSSCKGEKKPAANIEAKADLTIVPVKTSPVTQENEAGSIEALGIMMSEAEAKPAFKTGGVIDKVYFEEGQYVTKGQLLATLLMDEIDAQVRQAEEGLSKADRDMKRVKNLYADSVATAEQMQNVTTAFEVASRTVEIARFNRRYSEVRAPIAGRIIKQIMHSGEITGPGTPVCAIMGTGTKDWKIMAGLVDKDWARVKVGDIVNVRLDAYPNRLYTGRVTDKSSVGGNASGTFDIEVKLNDNPASLAAGLIAKLSILPSTKERMTTIPIEALVKTNGSSGEAFTVVDGKAVKIYLTIAKLLGDKVAVSAGLDGVDNVVTTGSMYLEEGDKVKL